MQGDEHALPAGQGFRGSPVNLRKLPPDGMLHVGEKVPVRIYMPVHLFHHAPRRMVLIGEEVIVGIQLPQHRLQLRPERVVRVVEDVTSGFFEVPKHRCRKDRRAERS